MVVYSNRFVPGAAYWHGVFIHRTSVCEIRTDKVRLDAITPKLVCTVKLLEWINGNIPC